ncbi:hypothetical protein PRUPE_1G006200 [Prunus persica]|uniref:Uncharacterized protein n=1 Tax=Prunus persica TaxID=3760 RepID=A0A251QQU2_PRUPE|nr:hypothetical protein PRUPE_1G006200 [Prunus persica]
MRDFKFDSTIFIRLLGFINIFLEFTLIVSLFVNACTQISCCLLRWALDSKVSKTLASVTSFLFNHHVYQLALLFPWQFLLN